MSCAAAAAANAAAVRVIARPSPSSARARARARRAAVVARAVDQSLNPRVAALNASKTVALTDLARSMKEAGADVIGLAAGEPDFATPEAVREAGKRAIDAGFTKYSPNDGTAGLRAAIAKKLKDENGLTYDASEIVLSNGAKQSVAQCVMAVCGPGDEVIVPAPYWVSYPEMVRLSGAESVILRTTADEGFLVTPEKLRAAITEKSRLLILCSPSNPSGAVYPKETLEELAKIVVEHPRLMVLSDEIYEHIVYAPAEHHSICGMKDMWERTMVVNGFSKSFAMTGWRLGYVAAPKRFARAMSMIQSQITSGPNSISQEAAMAALNLGYKGGDSVAEMVRAFEQRRNFVSARLNAIDGVKLPSVDGAFYVFPDVSALFGGDAEAEGFGPIADVDELCRYILEKGQVALVPGSAFGVPECLRISYAASNATLEDALTRIEKCLDPSLLKRNSSAAAR